jgi:hypothetical protein
MIAERFNDSKKVINITMDVINHVDATWKDIHSEQSFRVCDLVTHGFEGSNKTGSIQEFLSNQKSDPLGI